MAVRKELGGPSHSNSRIANQIYVNNVASEFDMESPANIKAASHFHG
jgi:hypothetical protein